MHVFVHLDLLIDICMFVFVFTTRYVDLQVGSQLDARFPCKDAGTVACA